jgi:hypothetical protein
VLIPFAGARNITTHNCAATLLTGLLWMCGSCPLNWCGPYWIADVLLKFFPVTAEPKSVILTFDRLVGGGYAFGDLTILFDFWFDDGAIVFCKGASFFMGGLLIALHF